MIIISLKYFGRKQKPAITKLERISKPGARVYRRAKKVPVILGKMGIAIISTSLGVMTDDEARKLKIGGELLCYIW
jgi:small subunit ribosomal protein S8